MCCFSKHVELMTDADIFARAGQAVEAKPTVE